MAFRLWLKTAGQKTLGDETFSAKMGFSLGVLPIAKEVSEVVIYHLLPQKGKASISKDEAINLVAGGLIQHWVFQNIYTIQKV